MNISKLARFFKIDYSPFARKEPLVVYYDLTKASSEMIKSHLRSWLVYRGYPSVEFEVQEHGGMTGRKLTAFYDDAHKKPKQPVIHPASAFLETGRYEHVMNDIEMMNPSACRAKIKNWLRKNGATGKIKSKTEPQQRTIFFWEE